MTALQALSIWKSIRRHHPFFKSGGKYGHDYNTMVARGYRRDADILIECVEIARRVGY